MTYRALMIPALIASNLAALAAPAIVQAQAADPAIATVDGLQNALIQVMKQGKALGAQGRYRQLEPAVERAFDIPAMTRFAVGPRWASLPAQDQAALVKAFTRLTVASYAHNFDSYDGEKFVTDPQVQSRGPDKLVRTKIIDSKGSPTDLAYRLRKSGGAWKIIDVFYKNSISELATRRSDFASAPNAAALVQKINALADKQIK